jgi:hypothetical protein
LSQEQPSSLVVWFRPVLSLAAFQSNFAKCLCDRSSTPPPLGGGAARQIASELLGQLNSDGWMNLDAMIKTFDAQ